MKKALGLLLLLAMLFALSGCNLIGFDEALDNAQLVAKVGDTEITKGEWLAYRDSMAAYMQQYYQQYGFNMNVTRDDVDGEMALEQMIENAVVESKLGELGILPLGEEDQESVDSYADSMMDLYRMLIRYQNHPDIETVEEEAERLAAAAEATPDEATEAEEPKATMTNAELEALLNDELAAAGITRDAFIEDRTNSLASEKLHDYTSEGVEVTDEQVEQEFESRVATQKETYDATPTAYASAVSAGSDVYYTPEGYRGVKNLLISLTNDDQTAINALQSTLTSAQNTLDSAQSQKDALADEPEDITDEEKAARAEEMTTLEETIASAQQTVEETTAELEAAKQAAFEAILPAAQAALERAKAGEDFDALIEELGGDTGMTMEPAKSRGYLVCEGLTQFVQPFQDAAMALEKIGDFSDLVETDYGYHILQYAQDIPSGTVELSDEIREDIREELLETAQDAAYEAAVTQWVSEASKQTFPKVMK